ncbi:hypothetical protein HZS_7578 [Henneguya salminicola]|nr:hypothetical protein HZS_7578 [Henneguya salminicola]
MAGFAGVTYWIYGIVPDVLKTRHQTASYGQYRGLSHLFTEIIKTEGVCKLFNGFVPVMIRSFPSNAICFLCYEYTSKFLKSYSS